ncbi:MAG: DUF1638 domain-containing protein [Limnochordia bacterium]|jgi:hypothetical protein
MYLKAIVCDVLMREVCHYAALSDHVIELTLLPQGLHREPDLLRKTVQEEIDKTEARHGQIEESNQVLRKIEYDAILLGYCLCSNGIVGLSSRKVPLITPRGHDCITLLLGSREHYQEYFNAHRGVYWYSAGWIERTMAPGRERYEQVYQSYVERYGQENADYLMDMEQKWFKEYSWATYIDWGLPKSDQYRRFTQEAAAFLGWNYDEIQGDPRLIRDLLNGNWDEEDFLRTEPGEVVSPSYDDYIICSQCPRASSGL